MEYRVLGSVEVREAAQPLPISSQKQLSLLAVLLLNANEVVPIDRLIDELWPFQPPADPGESVQALVYQVRRVVEGDAQRGSILERQGRGYRFRVGRDELDLHRFERLVRTAREARSTGDLDTTSWTLSEALALWNGPALANVSLEAATATRSQAARLDELRLTILVERIEIDLELGLEDELVGEVEALAVQHPLDERLRELQMLTLYRSGRQAEALQAYQEARSALLEELGIEPGTRLQTLQKAILRHDPELDLRPGPDVSNAPRRELAVSMARSLVAVALSQADLDPLLALAEPLGRSQLGRELILVMILDNNDDGLKEATSLVHGRRAVLLERGVEVRAAAFTSMARAVDISRLAARENVDLLLITAPPDLSPTGTLPDDAIAVLEQAPCDVGLLVRRDQINLDREIVVPFGGKEHDWAALEVGAWAASAANVPLILLGVRETSEDSERLDASRILADASLAVQQVLGIAADVRLVDSGQAPEFVSASEGAALLVVGLPELWRKDGIGPLRLFLAEQASAPVLFVRKGERPGGLAPRETATIFAWSLMPVADG